MKQFKLREEKSFVKILKEPPTQKKKVNWSRRVYLAMFIGIIFLVAKRIYLANMIIFANGQIDLPKQVVNFSNDIKILDLYVGEGSQICTGDTLFTYQIVGDELTQARLTARTPTSSEWIIREEMAIRKKIETNKIIIQQKQVNGKYLQDLIASKEALLLGGLHAEYSAYSDLQEEHTGLVADIDYHTKEIAMLRSHLHQLRSHRQRYATVTQDELGVYHTIKHYISPIDGVISDIYYGINEICYKKAEMVTIHQLRNASINTYFDPEEIKHIEVGDVVHIQFPDKSETSGIISKFFVSTYAVPSEFQKKYEPTERNIVAQVVPVNKADEHLWNSYYKMEVRVEKPRYTITI